MGRNEEEGEESKERGRDRSKEGKWRERRMKGGNGEIIEEHISPPGYLGYKRTPGRGWSSQAGLF